MRSHALAVDLLFLQNLFLVQFKGEPFLLCSLPLTSKIKFLTTCLLYQTSRTVGPKQALCLLLIYNCIVYSLLWRFLSHQCCYDTLSHCSVLFSNSGSCPPHPPTPSGAPRTLWEEDGQEYFILSFLLSSLFWDVWSGLHLPTKELQVPSGKFVGPDAGSG